MVCPLKDCPIVISDWVYDLSRVNLSDPGEIPWKNPLVKLNYDPQTAIEKKHVSGNEEKFLFLNHNIHKGSNCIRRYCRDDRGGYSRENFHSNLSTTEICRDCFPLGS